MILKGRDPDSVPLGDTHSGQRRNAILGVDNPQRPDCEDQVQPLAFTKDTIQPVHLAKSPLTPLATVSGQHGANLLPEVFSILGPAWPDKV